MTRDEFLEHAGKEVDAALGNRKNRMLNLVEQAWAEGKRNAEVETLKEALEAALDSRTADTPIEHVRSDMPHGEDDCILLYDGKEYKCKMGIRSEITDIHGAPTEKYKYEIYEV